MIYSVSGVSFRGEAPKTQAANSQKDIQELINRQGKYTKTEDTISTILAFALLGGFGYGIYFIIKKGKKFFNKLKGANSK